MTFRKSIPLFSLLVGFLFSGCGATPYFTSLTTPKSALLSLSSQCQYSLVAQGTSQSTSALFTVVNSGAASIPDLQKLSVASPASFTGGAFPGTNGACTNSLAAGASCTVEINFDSSGGSFFSAPAQLSYSGQLGNLQLSATVPNQCSGASGSLDLSFNPTGSVPGLQFAAGISGWTENIKLQSDGKLVTAGKTSGIPQVFTVARYTSSGVLDSSFNPSGSTPGVQVTGGWGGNGYTFGYASALQSDGKTIVAGVANSPSDYFAIARYTANGLLDSTFNPGGALPGTQTTLLGGGGTFDDIQAVAVQTDGGIVVGGMYYNGTRRLFAVARYTTGGVLDTTFNPTGPLPGTQTTDFGQDSIIASIALQADGKIVAGGVSTSGGHYIFALARYTTGGILDSTFNATGPLPGTVMTNIGGGANAIDSIVLQGDGKIVAGGYSASGSHFVTTIARYTSAGALDTTFNATGSMPGVLTTDLGSNSVIYSIALQSDGKIIAAADYGTPYDVFLIARYTSDGSLDATFNSYGSTPGMQQTDFGNDAEVFQVAVQSDGKIVAAGTYHFNTVALARYWP